MLSGEGMTTEAHNCTSFVCPCEWSGTLNNTYASVLVLGNDDVKSTLDEIIRTSTGVVANTSSYCLKCRRITPSLNASRTIQENLMYWKKQHAYYVACADFIRQWPKQKRGMRLRNRKKKLPFVDDE
jgi:hypothetical protein